MSPLEATWEDVAYLKEEFPDFNLEDMAVVNGGSIDMNKRMDGKGIQEETTRDVQQEVATTSEDDMKELSGQEEEHVEEITEKLDDSNG